MVEGEVGVEVFIGTTDQRLSYLVSFSYKCLRVGTLTGGRVHTKLRRWSEPKTRP